jgi:hypothetical protein
MALLRIKRPEQLKEQDPAAFGRLLGLDRAPEVKTLRRRLMDTAAEFWKHAINCNRMAKLSNDPETKGIWRWMAQRWLLCAKLTEEDEQSVARLRKLKSQRDADRLTTVGVCSSFANCARIL